MKAWVFQDEQSMIGPQDALLQKGDKQRTKEVSYWDVIVFGNFIFLKAIFKLFCSLASYVYDSVSYITTHNDKMSIFIHLPPNSYTRTYPFIFI